MLVKCIALNLFLLVNKIIKLQFKNEIISSASVKYVKNVNKKRKGP